MSEMRPIFTGMECDGRCLSFYSQFLHSKGCLKLKRLNWYADHPVVVDGEFYWSDEAATLLEPSSAKS